MDADSPQSQRDIDQPIKTAVPVAHEGLHISEGTFGDGVLEILEVTKTLENASIPCCMGGITALRYYGAGRVQFTWEICVPTGTVDAASSFLRTSSQGQAYDVAERITPQIQSMIHTYPRFKVRGVWCFFVLVPADDYHLDCNNPSVIERSYLGLPYPKLEVFAQSLLDSRDLVALTDLIDGMDLTEEWGRQYLDLEGTQDLAWAKRKNEEIQRLVPDPDESCFYERNEKPFSREDTWMEIVNTKERRLGDECPKEVYATRFRGRGSQDPRTVARGYL